MKKIEIGTFLDFQFVSNPSFSPDGAQIAFLVARADREANGYKSDLYLYSVKDGSVKRLISGGDAKTYAWTKDNTLLFLALRDEADKKEASEGKTLTGIYEIHPDGGEAVKAFSVPEKVTGIHTLPDGRLLLTIVYDNYKETRKKSYEVFDELPFWGNGLGYTNAKRNRYAIYERETGSLEWIADSWTDCIRFSALGDLLLYQAYPFHDSVRGLKPGLYLYNLKTKETKTFLEPETMRTGTIELLSETEGLVAAADNKYAGTKYCDFYKLNLADGSLSLFAPYDASIGSGSVGSDARYGAGRGQKALGDEFFFISTVGDCARLYKLSADGTVSGPLTSGSSCDSFDLSADGHIVSCEMQGLKLPELYLDGKQITDFNGALLSEHTLSTPEPFTFTAGDGCEIHGWVMKPADYEEGKTYPGVLHVHGGPRTVFSDVFHHEMQMWAGSGYFVFYCNPRGSDGRGTDFGDINGKYGTVDFANVMDFTDQVLERYPQIDKNRIAIAGGSYGGFMTNWAVGHTNRFAAAVSQRSIANWVSFEHNSDIGHTFPLSNQKVLTRENVELLWDQSPLKAAPNCKTPILFIHSDEDYRCYMAEGLAMYSAVKRNGCPAKLCLFHGENHELSRSGKPENRIDRMKEIVGWLDTYLK